MAVLAPRHSNSTRRGHRLGVLLGVPVCRHFSRRLSLMARLMARTHETKFGQSSVHESYVAYTTVVGQGAVGFCVADSLSEPHSNSRELVRLDPLSARKGVARGGFAVRTRNSAFAHRKMGGSQISETTKLFFKREKSSIGFARHLDRGGEHQQFAAAPGAAHRLA